MASLLIEVSGNFELDLDKRESIIRRALVKTGVRLWGDDPQTTAGLSRSDCWAMDSGHLEEAESYFCWALHIREAKLCPGDHLRLFPHQVRAGSVPLKLERLDEAEVLFRKAYGISKMEYMPPIRRTSRCGSWYDMRIDRVCRAIPASGVDRRAVQRTIRLLNLHHLDIPTGEDEPMCALEGPWHLKVGRRLLHGRQGDRGKREKAMFRVCDIVQARPESDLPFSVMLLNNAATYSRGGKRSRERRPRGEHDTFSRTKALRGLAAYL